MSIFEDNLRELEIKDCALYEACSKFDQSSDDVLIGDAYNGEHYLAVQSNNVILPLGSIYNPSYAAERYADQFKDFTELATVFLFGFGDGQVLRLLLSENYPVETCIVYEPSIELFCKILQEFDIRDLLSAIHLTIYVSDVNDQNIEQDLNKRITHTDWRNFCIGSLPVYSSVFEEKYLQCLEWHQKCTYSKKITLNTAIYFAKKSMQNEIKAQKWMVDGWAADSLIGQFPEEVPCIVVAAGPSLEKNVNELKNAKGKACIFAVDAAAVFLVQNGVIPDFICTVDANKKLDIFSDDRLNELPIFLSTSSNYQLLEQLEAFDPIYFSSISSFYVELFEQRGHQLWGTDGGGSVATMSFWIASQLGFRTIVLIGQDLAFTNMNSHAGTGKVKTNEVDGYEIFEVDGYYGDKVLSRGDFKSYIDWYSLVIPELSKDHIIINATEGGAKLKDAIQMSLREVIEKYCVKSVDCQKIYKSQQKIWDSMDDKRKFYQDMKDALGTLDRLQRKVDQGKQLVDRALVLMRRPSYSEKEFATIEKKVDAILTALNQTGLYGMLVNRIVENNIELYDSTRKIIDDSGDRRYHIYSSIYDHFLSLTEAIAECKELWLQSLKELNGLFHFEHV